MSDRYAVGLFDAGGDHPRLRWSTPAGVVAERRLDRADVDVLIERVSSAYSVAAPELSELGGVLYRWLDGPTWSAPRFPDVGFSYFTLRCGC